MLVYISHFHLFQMMGVKIGRLPEVRTQKLILLTMYEGSMLRQENLSRLPGILLRGFILKKSDNSQTLVLTDRKCWWDKCIMMERISVMNEFPFRSQPSLPVCQPRGESAKWSALPWGQWTGKSEGVPILSQKSARTCPTKVVQKSVWNNQKVTKDSIIWMITHSRLDWSQKCME